MEAKDYYHVLQVNPSSSMDEIRKAFRSLAMQYHPDTTNDNVLKTERFKDIKEAYSILSDPESRKLYDAKHLSSNRKSAPITVESIHQLVRSLNNELLNMHVLKVNYDYLISKLNTVLSNENVQILRKSSDRHSVEQIVQSLIAISKVLPYPVMIGFSDALLSLTAENHLLQDEVIAAVQKKKKEMLWNRYKILLVIGIAIIACVFIALVSKTG